MKLLEFQHIIQINDPALPHIVPLSRQQLWEGLLFRARYPGHFNQTLSSRLEAVTAIGFTRYLCFGGNELCDAVTLRHEEEIRTSTAGLQQPLFAESVTRIEEPEPGYLFVRFEYRRESANTPGGLNVDDYLKAAYVQNDLDAIKSLREMIQKGLPGAGSWLQ